MAIRRAVPDLVTQDLAATREFYLRLGFEVVMDLGWVVNLAAPGNPTAQIILVDAARVESPQPDMSVEVDDVDAAHAAMTAAGAEVVYALRDEPWGGAAVLRPRPERHRRQRRVASRLTARHRPAQVDAALDMRRATVVQPPAHPVEPDAIPPVGPPDPR